METGTKFKINGNDCQPMPPFCLPGVSEYKILHLQMLAWWLGGLTRIVTQMIWKVSVWKRLFWTQKEPCSNTKSTTSVGYL